MKNTILLFLFFGMLTNAQINRFFYEYKSIPDSNNKEDIKKEMMLLDIDKKGSSYYSRDKFVSDSTSMAEIQKQIKGGGGSISVNRRESQGATSYKVVKSYPDFKTYLFTRVSTDQYKVKEDQKPEWKILADKQKVGEYNTQKATANYGGREWIAWFSTDIPFQDGPYKFYGLPGLIVKLEDTTGSHIMTLVGNKKIEAPAEQKELEIPGNVRLMGVGGKEIEVTKDQYKKVWKDYVNDPAKNMRQMMMGNSENSKVSFKVRTDGGKEISDPNQVFREIEKRAKESLAKNNNPIEPDLVK
ncbi:GLPGLI family protein [Chryseobacterium ginsenosidimutans]|uniref:GLPGLI family protein n=1 Tax=Chryseobacterium ginsenosidimutans TaxID=687846 RepID=UPI00277E3731|nr:GLPGLI family protein [Chryseobacterium ginsenosidimutans]MDQ0593976.1 GLPGLI family protein [Chryseobacterium ginsenosidimutans]